MVINQHLEITFLQEFCFLIPREIPWGVYFAFVVIFYYFSAGSDYNWAGRTVMKAVTKNNYNKWQNCNFRQDD